MNYQRASDKEIEALPKCEICGNRATSIEIHMRVAHPIGERLEYLRGELRAERISYGELAELQGLAKHIKAGDIELLEAAGVPEF
jgi:hypothetical protein